MTKQDTATEATTTLNEKLLDEFSDNLETTINKVCENNSGVDPRLELLVTLCNFSAQVGVDSGYSKEEFLALMGEIFDDFEPEEKPQPIKPKSKIDISKMN